MTETAGEVAFSSHRGLCYQNWKQIRKNVKIKTFAKNMV